MTRAATDLIVRHVRDLRADDLSDTELLDRFTRRGDETAFCVLVRRHGPLVAGVCRRCLGTGAQADDVFQATFLVLARRARAIRSRTAVGSWLYGVARRLARKVQRAEARRRRHERRAAEARTQAGAAKEGWAELLVVLDEELERLPDSLRAPLLLCYLEGRTQDEAAHLLGWSLATLRRRQERGRELLRLRMTRRGATLGAGLSAWLVHSHATAAVPVALAEGTTRVALDFAAGKPLASVAAGLAREALQVGWVSKMAAVLLVLTTGFVAAGAAGWLMDPGRNQEGPSAAAKTAPNPAAEAKDSPKNAFGDPLPPRAIARLGTSRWRHANNISAVAYSPDGKMVASGCNDGHLVLWDATTGQLLREIPRDAPGSPLRALYFLSHGSHLLCLASPKVYLWEVATGKELSGGQIHGTHYPTSFAVSPDGRVLARGEDRFISLYDLPSRRDVGRFEGHEAPVFGVTYSPKGDRLASADKEGTIYLWNLATGKQETRLTGHQGSVWSLRFSPDGKLLASAGEEPVIRLWDVAGKRELGQFQSRPMHPAMVFWSSQPLLFTPDGKFLAQWNRLWEVATRKQVRQFGTDTGYGPSAISPDGKTLAFAVDKHVHTWDVATGRTLQPAESQPGEIRRFALSLDGKLAASVGEDSGKVLRLWNASTSREVGHLSVEGTYFCTDPQFSPDGRFVAVGAGDHTIRVLEAGTGREVLRMRGHEHAPVTLQFSRDGRLLVSEGWDRTVRIWEVAGGKEVQQFPIVDDNGKPTARSAPDGSPLPRTGGGVALSPDGKLLATWNLDRSTSLWDLASNKLVRQLRGAAASSLAFSSDGRTLLTFQGELAFWDVATGQPLLPFGAPPPRLQPQVINNKGKIGSEEVAARMTFPTTSASTFALAPDDRTLALARYEKGSPGEVVYLYEMATGKERLRLRGHRGKIYALHFTADGRTLASASRDTTALFWDLTGRRSAATGGSEKERFAAWEDLADDDAERAYQAIWKLASTPVETLAMLRQRLAPAAALKVGQIEKLITDLDSADFATRRRAREALDKLGHRAEAAVEQALAGNPSPEVRRQLEPLLAQLRGPLTVPEELRQVRAVEVADRVGTPEARRLLLTWAGGDPAARLTREAQGTLRRLVP